MPDAPLTSEISLIESLSKVFAIALGILYLLGFLVVAAYLSQFGVSSFSVLQLQYLLAGIWLLGPPVLHTTILHAQRRFDERVVPEVLTGLCVLLMAFAVWFSVRIYPLIPSSLGGGKPLTVAFFEGDKKMPEEIQRQGSTRRSIPYKLVLSTDKYYVVLSPSSKERSLEVSRESVAGMVVLE